MCLSVGTILLQLKEQHNYCDRQTLKNGVTSFSLPARKDHIQRQFCLMIRSYLASHVGYRTLKLVLLRSRYEIRSEWSSDTRNYILRVKALGQYERRLVKAPPFWNLPSKYLLCPRKVARVAIPSKFVCSSVYGSVQIQYYFCLMLADTFVTLLLDHKNWKERISSSERITSVKSSRV